MSARYEVCSIEGYAVSGRHKSLMHWIADRLYGFREVATYPAHKGVHPATRKRHAHERCAELNAEHDAWMRYNGYAASGDRSVDTVDRPTP